MFKSVTGLGHGHSNIFNTLLGKIALFLAVMFCLPLSSLSIATNQKIKTDSLLLDVTPMQHIASPFHKEQSIFMRSH